MQKILIILIVLAAGFFLVRKSSASNSGGCGKCGCGNKKYGADTPPTQKPEN